MRLAVDARVLAHPPTGVARYLAALLSHLPEFLPPGAELMLFADRPLDGFWGEPPWRVETLRWPLPGGDPLWRQARLALRLCRQPRPDLLFCPFYTIPLLAPVPAVLTIHDVAFLAQPHWFDWRGRAAFRLVRPSAQRARAILTPSRFSAEEIVRRLGVPAENVRVTPLGVDAARFGDVSPQARREVREWLGFSDPYVLHLGAVHARRLPEVLVRAFASFAADHEDVRLVVAGPDLPPGGPDVAGLACELGIAGRVVRRPWVPEAHLPALLAEAAVFCYLSLYEGFGLPLLEALAAGAPTVALRRASLPEVAGDAVIWVDEPDPQAVARQLRLLLRDSTARRQLAEAGRARAQRFTWRAAAHATWEVLRAALEH